MTWDLSMLQLEVAVELRAYAPLHWSRIEEALWQVRKREHAAWSEHGQWWRKTTHGKKVAQRRRTEYVKELKSKTARVQKCQACGRDFAVSIYRARRGRDRVCSSACKGASRTNIKRYTVGVDTLTLSEWSQRTGIKMQTIWRRIHTLGWTPAKAVGPPGALVADAQEAEIIRVGATD